MGGDRGYTRFFAYLNFFVFSMLLLVLAANFLLLIVGWAFVGAASYLLISFWYRRTTATTAGIKAFVINVVGDVGLVLGTYFIFQRHRHARLPEDVRGGRRGASRATRRELVAGCILLLVGAFAKSAQVPLHTWLPDAMEGPTPVSALIHAATMVTAGVYLIARMHPLFEQAPDAADVGAIVGCVTLLIAATIGLVVTDLKRVIAYSTMSQIGYMIMAVSSAAYAAGMFHLMTHAFFKALLFMAAGSVIAAMGGDQDLDRMGGFRKAMPFTFGCMVIGGLALSGIPPFSGFFSKDEIIALRVRRAAAGTSCSASLGYVGAFLTAIYTFRMIFRAFYGEPCPEARGARARPPATTRPSRPTRRPARSRTPTSASPARSTTSPSASSPMKVAMGALAVLGDRRRLPADPGRDRRGCTTSSSRRSRTRSSTRRSSPRAALAEWIGLLVGARASALAGIVIAYTLWVQRPGSAGARSRRASRGLHRFFVNKWYFDEAIDFAHRAARAPGSGASPAARSSACSSTARWSAARPASCARCSAARARRPVRLPALLRRAAARRPHRRSAPTS